MNSGQVSIRKPGLTPVPRIDTRCRRASSCSRAAASGSRPPGKASSSQVDTTLAPAAAIAASWSNTAATCEPVA